MFTLGKQTFFDKQSVQSRILTRVVVYWTLYHALLWGAMFLLRVSQHHGEIIAGAEPRTFSELYSAFALQHFSVWVCGAAILPVILWDAFKFSHRLDETFASTRPANAENTRSQVVTSVGFHPADPLVDLQHSFHRYVESLAAARAAQATPVGQAGEMSSSDAVERQIIGGLQSLQSELARLSVTESAAAKPASAAAPGVAN